MSFDVTFKGLKQVNANIKRYDITAHRAIEKAFRDAGFSTRAAATKRVPVQFGVLQRSLTVNWSGSGKNHDGVEGVTEPTFKIGEFKVKVGTNVRYAHMQEFGTWGSAKKFKRGGSEAPTTKGRTSRKRKRPSGGFLYLTRAFILNERQLDARVKMELKKVNAKF